MPIENSVFSKCNASGESYGGGMSTMVDTDDFFSNGKKNMRDMASQDFFANA